MLHVLRFSTKVQYEHCMQYAAKLFVLSTVLKYLYTIDMITGSVAVCSVQCSAMHMRVHVHYCSLAYCYTLHFALCTCEFQVGGYTALAFEESTKNIADRKQCPVSNKDRTSL